MKTSAKPVLVIVDASVAVTGALVSAARQAELLRDEIETVLVLPRGHAVPAPQLSMFARVIEMPIVPLRKSLSSLAGYGPALIRATLALRDLLRAERCERVQFNDFYLAQGALLRLAGYRGTIVTFLRIDPRRFGIAGRVWMAAARRSADELVAVSRFIQSVLPPMVKTRLLYEHVTAAQIARNPRTGSAEGRTLLFVGNLIEGKGQDHAVEAFNRIALAHPEARLHFVGGDMGLEKNRAFARRVADAADGGPARDRISFAGATDDLSDDYATAYAALNFSASESFSLTCLDACAQGLAVVATRCGGPEEIVVDGQTGFLVPVGDIEAMSARMAWLLDHPVEARAMGSAGRAHVGECFSPDRARAAFSEVFDLPQCPA